MSLDDSFCCKSMHCAPMVWLFRPVLANVMNKSSVTQNWKKRKTSDALGESPMTHLLLGAE